MLVEDDPNRTAESLGRSCIVQCCLYDVIVSCMLVSGSAQEISRLFSSLFHFVLQKLLKQKILLI